MPCAQHYKRPARQLIEALPQLVCRQTQKHVWLGQPAQFATAPQSLASCRTP